MSERPPDDPFGAPPPSDPSGAAPSGGPSSISPSDPFASPPPGGPSSDPSRDPFGAPPSGPPAAPAPWRGPAPPADLSAPPAGANAEGAIPALVLGILGLVFCPLCAPFAWYVGRRAERLVDASGGVLSGRGEATAGKILGIVMTILLILGILLLIVLIVIGSTVLDTGGGGSFENL
jgi:hypothetical protein